MADYFRSFPKVSGGSVAWLGDDPAAVVLRNGFFPAETAGNINASLAATETGSDTAAIAGAVGIAATFAASEEGADTSAISGAVSVAGALAGVETGQDSATIAGRVIVAGALAAAEAGADVANISGVVATAPITGQMAAIETGSDTALIVRVFRSPGRGSVAITMRPDAPMIERMGPPIFARPTVAASRRSAAPRLSRG